MFHCFAKEIPTGFAKHFSPFFVSTSFFSTRIPADCSNVLSLEHSCLLTQCATHALDNLEEGRKAR